MGICEFRSYLAGEHMSENTILSYCYAIEDFTRRYPSVGENTLRAYRTFLIENYSPATVNVRIRAVNKYLHFIGKESLQLKGIRVQQASFLENAISNGDYERLKAYLRKEPNKQWYFCVCFMGSTGVRVSELLQLQADDIRRGRADICGKGGKRRCVFIPDRLREQALAWMAESGREAGYLFLNRAGGRITVRGIALQLRHLAEKYDIDSSLVHPHAFRHLFARNFLDRRNDVALLADLLGHSSIETTRIYLRRSGEEQRAIIENTVNW